MMINGIKLEDGKYGRRAVVVSAWTKEMAPFLLDRHVVELVLNYAKGWHGNDLAFLAELPQLRSLIILDWQIPSVEPIHFLHDLRSLDVLTYCKTEIRFSAFPRLEECGLEWRPKAASLFDCTTLKSLFVNNYKGQNTDPFGRLTNLESLAILNAPIKDLTGLATLRKLRSLRIGNLRTLTSLAGIQELTNLERLDINTCRKIHSIDEIGYLCKLRELYLCNDGDIESFKPLARLTGLESVGFCESTNVMDGDLSALLTQKNLPSVSYQNRKHYSHRREEFERE